MNFSKLFLMVTLSVSLSGVVSGMRNFNEDLVDTCRKTPLNLEAIQELLQAGANPNTQDNELCFSLQSRGCTPLHYAVAEGNLQVVTLLLQYGADFNIANANGLTPRALILQNGQMAQNFQNLLNQHNNNNNNN